MLPALAGCILFGVPAVAIRVLLLGLSVHATAQSQSPQPGERVRIHLPEAVAQPENPVVNRLAIRGTVSRWGHDTLFVHIPGTQGELAVPRAAMLGLYRSRGVPSRPASGIRRAIGFGLMAGLYTGLSYGSASKWGVNHRSDAILIGLGFGATVGFLHGALFPTERWTRVRS